MDKKEIKKTGRLLLARLYYKEDAMVPNLMCKGLHATEVEFRTYDDEGNAVHPEGMNRQMLNVCEDGTVTLRTGTKLYSVPFERLAELIRQEGQLTEE